MDERNRLLRAARERLRSRRAPGERLSRAELAEWVNAWLWERTERRFGLDDHLVAKWERGIVRYPTAPYRSALRAVLGVETDAELGFVPPARRQPSAAPDDRAWTRTGILDDATTAVEIDVLNRRDVLRVAAIGGAGLLGPLAHWLEPLADGPLSGRSGAFAVVEVEAVEQLVATLFQQWHSDEAGLGRTAVVGQLSDLSDRLRGAPAGPLTDRAFLAAAELANIAGWMAFDAGAHRIAQQHYLTAVQMAKVGGNSSFGAFALASLARQSFDLGAPDDGLEIVHLAQRGTRDSVTPGLRSLLAVREAWGHAQQGNVHAFSWAVDVAEQAHVDIEPDGESRWLRVFDAAELAGSIGAGYRDLALYDRRQTRQTQETHHAAEYLGQALVLRDPSLARNCAMNSVSLGRVHLLAGEPELSAVTVRSALPLIDPHRPGLLGRKLADWHREAAPFAAVPEVQDTREQTRELVGV
ncbi:MAG: helix-turn-helix domain-containing protein [Pseudonocardia sp.]